VARTTSQYLAIVKTAQSISSGCSKSQKLYISAQIPKKFAPTATLNVTVILQLL
jgi:hypothetical protein